MYFPSWRTRSDFRKKLTILGGVLIALGAGAGLSGCASVTARTTGIETKKLPHKAPAHIYVKNFSTPSQNLRVDRSGAKLATFEQKLADHLSTSLAKQLDRNLASAKVIPNSQVLKREDAWLIEGSFDRVDQGSRALRAFFGFGLGATKVMTTVLVYNLSTPRPTHLLTIKTTGGSNAAPGTVVNFAGMLVSGPVGALPGVIMGAGTGAIPGLGADINRTAREIAAKVSDYCYQEGLISKAQAMRPKPVGNAEVRLGDPKRPKHPTPTTSD